MSEHNVLKVYFHGVHKDKFFYIDKEDCEKVTAKKWYLGKNYISRIEYQKGSGKEHPIRKALVLSRFILNVTDPKTLVDHIDGNILNNSKRNLRVVTHTQNMWNTHKIYAQSGLKGAYKSAHRPGWESKICCNKKRIFLGYFRTKEAAAKAYNKAASKLFGEYACLNKI